MFEIDENRFVLDGSIVAELADDPLDERPYRAYCCHNDDDPQLNTYTHREAAVIAHAMLSGLQHVIDLPDNIAETLRALEKFASS